MQTLKEIMSGYEEWRKMKVVVIGHGQIGKTTLIHHIHEFFNQQHNNSYQVRPLLQYLLLLFCSLFATGEGNARHSVNYWNRTKLLSSSR